MHTLSHSLRYLLIALTAFVCGCSIPRHTIGLDQVLIQELGKPDEYAHKYRCTAGAHRGASVEHMENTRGALEAACTNIGYAFIEFDIQYSSDDEIVVFHDKSLRRLFDEKDKVKDLTYAELMKLSGGRITSYKEVMEFLKGNKLNIEIKSQGDLDQDERLVDYLIADIEARGIDDDVVVSSISKDVITYVGRRYPKIATGQIFWIKSSTYLPFDALTRKLYTDITKTDADYLMLHIANLRNIKDLLNLKPKDKTVVFWDFDDRMYIVHKELSDRLWGNSWLRTCFDQLRYKLRSRKHRTSSKKGEKEST